MNTEERDAIILTPEHVQIRLMPAGLGSRFIALSVDFFLVISVSTLLQRIFGLLASLGIGSAINITVSFALFWFYNVYFEVRHNGQSPGKKLAGLRVVDARGLPVTVQQSFIRNIVRALDFAPLFYGLGALISLFDRHNRRLGDIVADTIVIKETQLMEYKGELTKSRRYNSLKLPATKRLINNFISIEEREFLLTLCLRAEGMEEKARFDLMDRVGDYYRRLLKIEDPHLSGENLVRDLTAICYEKQ